MALSAYYVFNQAVKGSTYVTVPDVTGLPITQAANLLVESGLEMGAQKHVVNAQVPEYHVIFQRPTPNTVLRTGRKVLLTISAGKEYESAPSLIGKNLESALSQLQSTRLLAGAISRMPHNAPRDTIIGQEPEPDWKMRSGGEVHLLVSNGPGSVPVLMPDILGKSLEEAQLILARLNVTVVPFDVERVGAEYEVVLGQTPSPGSLLSENESVSFDVRLSSSSFLPSAHRKVAVSYTVPPQVAEAQIRVDMIDAMGLRTVLYPLQGDYLNGIPPSHPGGTVITFPDVAYASETTVEFYLNGELHRSYYYEGHNEPILTEMNVTALNAGTQDDAFRPQLNTQPEKQKRRFFRFNN